MQFLGPADHMAVTSNTTFPLLGQGPSLRIAPSHLSLICFLTLFSIPIVISVTVGYSLNPNNKKLLFKSKPNSFLLLKYH